MDMSNSVYKEYEKGTHERSPFNPDKCRTGSPYAIVDALGGDRIPLDVDFDYRNIDTDIIYLWLQGGAPKNTKPLECLKHLREQWDGVILINWEEVYWSTDTFAKRAFEGYLEGAKYCDAVVCGFKDFDKRMQSIGINIPWRYLITPYDTKWLKHKYFDTPKDEPKRVYSMVHGRNTVCDRAMLVMHELKDKGLELVLNRYRFLSREDLELKIARRLRLNDIGQYMKIIDVMEPWDVYIKYLASSYIFIDEYPVYSQSHATIDAACSGTPTVSHNLNSTEVTVFPDLVVSDLNNYEDWMEKINKLLNDKDFYEEMRRKAYILVDHYSTESYLSQLEGLYKELKH